MTQYSQVQREAEIEEDSQGYNYFCTKHVNSVKSGQDRIGGIDYQCKYVKWSQ